MTGSLPIESIYAVDCGSIFTKAALIDVVEGQFRLVSQERVLSTHRPPQPHILLGIAESMASIEAKVGRRLLDPSSQLIMPEKEDGNGVDAFLAVSSAGEPLRVFLAGLARDVSLLSARSALRSVHVAIVGELSLEDRFSRPEGVEYALERLDRARPDVVLMVGGIDGSAPRRLSDLAALLHLAYQVREEDERAPIVFAGDAGMQEQVRAAFGDLCEVYLTENVRPAIDVENPAPLAELMHKLYVERKLNTLPGMERVDAWSETAVIPSSQALGHSLAYLSNQYGVRVLALDVGASQASLHWALDGRRDAVILHGMGLSTSAGIAEERGWENVLRWLPEHCERLEAEETLTNLDIYPTSVPGSRNELLLVHAVTREALSAVLEQARPRWPAGLGAGSTSWDLIILSGAVFGSAAAPGQAMLTMLDTLQPAGVSTVVVDTLSLAPMAGAMAQVEPLAAAHLLERDAFLSLGTVLAPVGSGKEGEIAVRIRVHYEDGRHLNVDVESGALEVIPLPAGQKARLDVRVGRRFELGWGRRRRGASVEVEGGLMGIVVDTRGRPLPHPADMKEHQQRVQQWLWQVGA